MRVMLLSVLDPIIGGVLIKSAIKGKIRQKLPQSPHFLSFFQGLLGKTKLFCQQFDLRIYFQLLLFNNA